MAQIYLPDFVGKSDQAVVVLVSSLNEELDGILKRFHRGEQVAYRFAWNLGEDENQSDLVVFVLEFDSGEQVSIGLSPHHWDCLPSILSLGYLVLVTDPDLLGPEGTAGEDDEPRALVIHNAFLGMDDLVNQVAERVKAGKAGNLDLLLKLLEIDRDAGEKQYH